MSKEAKYYKLMGVTAECTIEQLRHKYIKLLKRWNPDHNVGNEFAATEMTKKIIEANAYILKVIAYRDWSSRQHNKKYEPSYSTIDENQRIFTRSDADDLMCCMALKYPDNEYMQRQSARIIGEKARATGVH